MASRERKPPRRMTENSIANSALAYLARFSSSSANLRQVLTRKVMRATAHHGDDPTPLLAKIETVIARYLESGILNDALYAETQVRNLRRRGGSTRIIAQRLAAKGIDSDLVSETLAESATDNRAAAIAFARRRRLGPFRSGDRAEFRQRDLAALGRAGFEYKVAASVIDAADVEALDDLI